MKLPGFLGRLFGQEGRDLTIIEGDSDFNTRVKEIDEMKDLPVNDSPELEGSELLAFVNQDGRYAQVLMATFSKDKNRMGKELKELSSDTFVSGALEIYTDDAVQYDRERGRALWPKSDNKYKDDIIQFMDDFDVENRIWGWAHDLALYGNVSHKVEGTPKKGITVLDDVIDPFNVWRIESNAKLIGFWYLPPAKSSSPGSPQIKRAEMAAPYEYVNYMMRTKHDSKAFVNVNDEAGNMKGKLTTRRGVSLIEDAIIPLKSLRLLEQSIALARVSRAGYVRIFHVNTTGLNPKQRKKLIHAIHNKLKKDEYVNTLNKKYQTDYAPAGFSDDIIMPYTDRAGEIRAEGVGGDVNIRDIVDLEYMRDKVFAALRIPKAYLGFEETLPGSMGSTTLLRLDIRYSRSVKKLQRFLLQGIQRLIQIHLAYKLERVVDPKDVQLQMGVISGAEEAERVEAFGARVRNLQDFSAALDTMNLPPESKRAIDKEFAVKWALGQFLPEMPYEKLFKIKTKDETPEPSPDSSDDGGNDLGGLLGFMQSTEQSFLGGDLNAFLPVQAHRKALKEMMPDNKRYDEESEAPEETSTPKVVQPLSEEIRLNENNSGKK